MKNKIFILISILIIVFALVTAIFNQYDKEDYITTANSNEKIEEQINNEESEVNEVQENKTEEKSNERKENEIVTKEDNSDKKQIKKEKSNNLKKSTNANKNQNNSNNSKNVQKNKAKNVSVKKETKNTQAKETKKSSSKDSKSSTNSSNSPKDNSSEIIKTKTIEKTDKSKIVRNEEMINKLRVTIQNNVSDSMKEYGYTIKEDSSIKELTNQFTYTEKRVKSMIYHKFGTIRIYAEDFYDSEGNYVMTGCYII